jgi:glucose-6-phosphate isomerase
MLKFDFKTFNNVIDDSNYKRQIHDIRKIFESSKNNLDWYDIKTCHSAKELEKIKKVSHYIQNNADVFIVIGSLSVSLNSKAIIDMFTPKYEKNKVEIIYVGDSLDSTNLRDVLTYVQDKDIVLNVISKSGNTIETNLMFDVFYDLMEAKYENKELKKRIIITTDSKEGRLRKLVKENGFVSFPIKKNIIERYSIMTTTGLLPMCVMGIDIDKLIEGYSNGKKYLDKAYIYAVLRDILYHQGRKVEVISEYNPRLNTFIKYIQTILVQTQGRNNVGILPVISNNTGDIDSIGQYLYNGDTIAFETIIAIANTEDINISDKSLSKINHLAMLNNLKVHQNHTPSNIITLSRLNEKNVGELIYFYLVSAAIG